MRKRRDCGVRKSHERLMGLLPDRRRRSKRNLREIGDADMAEANVL
jgi:hypothetical protein